MENLSVDREPLLLGESDCVARISAGDGSLAASDNPVSVINTINSLSSHTDISANKMSAGESGKTHNKDGVATYTSTANEGSGKEKRSMVVKAPMEIRTMR